MNLPVSDPHHNHLENFNQPPLLKTADSYHNLFLHVLAASTTDGANAFFLLT